MLAVVNTISLTRPLDDAVFEAARRDMPPRIAALAGIHAVHMIRTAETELVLVIVGEDEAAIEGMRDAIGDEWMRANVIPIAAAPPQRVVGEVEISYQRR